MQKQIGSEWREAEAIFEAVTECKQDMAHSRAKADGGEAGEQAVASSMVCYWVLKE